MSATLHSLAPVTLTVSGGSSLTIPVESMGFTPEILGNVVHHSGNTAPTLVAVPGANPRIVLSVPFKTAYETFGFVPKKLTALSCYLSKFADFVRAGTLAHNAVALAANQLGAAQILGWSVNVDGILMANVEIALLSLGGMTHPLELKTGLTLPTLSGTPALHTLGPAKINNVVIPGCTGHDGGVNAPLIVNRSDGDLYPRVAARPQEAPSINLAHADPVAVLAALGLLGTDISATTEVYFKEYDPDTGVANADSGTAISITLSGGRLHPTALDARQGQVATTGIAVMPTSSDGLTSPLAVTLNATSPAE